MKKNWLCFRVGPEMTKLLKKMKLTVFLLFVTLLGTMAAESYSQSTKLTVDMTNSTVKEILNEIENSSEFRFFYSGSIDVERRTSISVRESKIFDILDELFKGTEVVYEVKGRQIALVKNNESLFDNYRVARQVQQKTISGKVTDSSRSPLPGVTVIIKGTTNGTVTNFDGEYTLTNISADATLQFSFVGMKTQEIPIEGESIINIILTEEVIGIDEVVAIGYGTMKKKDITGAVGSIKRKDILSNPHMNAVQSIQGKIAGVDISTSAHQPGSLPTVRIRGNRSINATNDPLYIVDGIAFEGTLSDINSSDVESIDVLKDASATAIYGSRGANGVILITTRRGKAGKTVVSYDGYYGLQIDNKLDVMNGAEIAELRREAKRNANRYESDVPSLELDKSMFYYPDKYMIESVSAGYDEIGNYDPTKVKSYDWIDAITRLGVIQDHQISIAGGNNNTKTLFSAGYFDNEGVVKGYGYSKYSLRLTIDQNVNKWLKFGGSLASSFNKKNETNNVYSWAAQTNPLSPFYDEDGVLQVHPSSETTYCNPILVAKNDIFEHKANTLYSSLFAEVNIMKGLKYRINFGPDYKTGRSGYLYSSDGSQMGGESIAKETTFNQFHFTLDNLLYYDKIFDNNHKLGITALQSIEEYKYENMSGSVSGLPYEYQKWYNLGTATSITGLSSGYTQWKLSSYMTRINYSFKDKYLITLTGRYDGSSRLAEGHKYTFFPSAAFSWRLMEEPFIKRTELFDNLKLRIGYGMTGNTAIAPYATLGSLARTTYVTGDTAFLGYAPSSLSNANLGWEKTSQYNLGLDFSILNNRLSGTIDAYRQDTRDLLLSKSLPIASGFSSVTENVGSTRNTGLEVSLAGIILKSANGFKWNAEVMFYTNKEEITELYNGKVDDVGNRWFIGHSINTYYDYKFDGIWQDTEEDKALMAKYNANGSSYAPGEIRLYDKDGNETINSDDRCILGSTVPKWTGSLNSRMEYKGFDLSFYIYTRQGQMVYSSMNGQFEGRFNWLNVNYWTPENQSNDFPRPVAGRQTPLNFSSICYKDGSFVKLKTITLGYSFPQRLISKLSMSKLRLYATAQNPFLFTKFWGIDPEGATGMSYPSVKTFMFGISTSF